MTMGYLLRLREKQMKSTNTTSPTGGIFGTNTTAPAAEGGGLFGTNTTAPTTGGGGMFGTNTTAPTAAGGGMFGTNITNPFGGIGGGASDPFGGGGVSDSIANMIEGGGGGYSVDPFRGESGVGKDLLGFSSFGANKNAGGGGSGGDLLDMMGILSMGTDSTPLSSGHPPQQPTSRPSSAVLSPTDLDTALPMGGATNQVSIMGKFDNSAATISSINIHASSRVSLRGKEDNIAVSSIIGTLPSPPLDAPPNFPLRVAETISTNPFGDDDVKPFRPLPTLPTEEPPLPASLLSPQLDAPSHAPSFEAPEPPPPSACSINTTPHSTSSPMMGGSSTNASDGHLLPFQAPNTMGGGMMMPNNNMVMGIGMSMGNGDPAIQLQNHQQQSSTTTFDDHSIPSQAPTTMGGGMMMPNSAMAMGMGMGNGDPAIQLQNNRQQSSTTKFDGHSNPSQAPTTMGGGMMMPNSSMGIGMSMGNGNPAIQLQNHQQQSSTTTFDDHSIPSQVPTTMGGGMMMPNNAMGMGMGMDNGNPAIQPNNQQQ